MRAGVVAFAALWVGATLVLAELRWFRRLRLAQRLAPYTPGVPARGRSGALSVASFRDVAYAERGDLMGRQALDGAALPELATPGTPPTLAWDADAHQVNGTGGCNRYAGRGFLRGTALFAQEVAAGLPVALTAASADATAADAAVAAFHHAAAANDIDRAERLMDGRGRVAAGSALDVGEVPGACFCCNFRQLTETVQQLQTTARPDVVLAEPVGSCTDLVATVREEVSIEAINEAFRAAAESGSLAGKLVYTEDPSRGIDILRVDLDALPEPVKAEARCRLRVIQLVEGMQDALGKYLAVETIARAEGKAPRTLWNWLEMIDGVEEADRLPYLAPRHRAAKPRREPRPNPTVASPE